MEVAAQKAGKAVPAAAMVGALAVASQAHESPGPSRSAAVPNHVVYSPLDTAGRPVGPAAAASLVRAERPARPVHAVGLDHPARSARAERLDHPALPVNAARPEGHTAAARTYTVQPGDTLSGIAFRFYGRARAWNWLYQVNRAKIANPNLILPGQMLRVPRDIPARFGGTGAYVGSTGKARDPQHAVSGGSASGQPQLTSALEGTLGCTALEALWREAGGAPSAQVTAGSIAMAESSGNQYATGPYGERGYWQINPVHGALATYNAYGNARAAVTLSDDGSNWSPWSTFVDGAYMGKC
jgi:hypothetical protein